MFSTDQYQLLDFGRGEKLERFGNYRVRRTTPSVPNEASRSPHADWSCDLRYVGQANTADWNNQPENSWQVRHGEKVFNLKPTPAGQIGMFPEQAVNWSWIEKLPADLKGLKAINLFGYTGGTSMALASRGVDVTHVDAAANVVQWAKTNARDTGLENHPIRWIVDDAMKYIGREIRRGRKYDILIADPPSYGTGPKKEKWKIATHFDLLLANLVQLASDQWRAILITCHSPGFDSTTIQRKLEHVFPDIGVRWQAFPLLLESKHKKNLASGCVVRTFREFNT